MRVSMKKAITRLSVGMLIVVLIGGAIWLHLFSQQQSLERSLGDAHELSDTEGFNLVPVPQETANGTETEKIPEIQSSGELFGAEYIALGERFERLVERMRDDDVSAAHLALQIARICKSYSEADPAMPPVGHDRLLPPHRKARADLEEQCHPVLASPALADIESTFADAPLDVLEYGIRREIDGRFADEGVEAALHAAVDAIHSRPDETTVIVVGNKLVELDVPVYLRSLGLLQSGMADVPSYQQDRLRDALLLLACDFGGPCGPGSLQVQMLCIVLGTCVPGADLATIYREEMLSAQEWRDTQALLDYVRRM